MKRKNIEGLALVAITAALIIGLIVAANTVFRASAADLTQEASREYPQKAAPHQKVAAPIAKPVKINAGTAAPRAAEWEPEEEDAICLAKTLYGECRGIKDKAKQAAVCWVILNRVDSPRFKGETVKAIVTAPGQFAGYKDDNPVDEELKALAEDVLTRWHEERCGLSEEVGRTIPSDYFFFHGDGKDNHFRKEFKDKTYWDWSLASPYKEETDE